MTLSHRIQQIAPLLYVSYLSLAGALCVLGAQNYANLNMSLIPVFPSIGIIFGIYILNRYTDFREDFANDAEKAIYFSKRQGYLWAGMGMLALTYLGLIVTRQLTMHHMLLLALGLMYSWRMIPWLKWGEGLVLYRIKDIPVMKNVVVAFLWGTSIFVIPLTGHSVDLMGNPHVALLIVAFTLSTWSNTFFNDVRDIEGDALVGTRTLATQLGEKRSRSLIQWVNAVWFCACALTWALGGIKAAQLVFFATMAAFPVLITLLHAHGSLSKQRLGHLSELDLVLMLAGLYLLPLLGAGA